MVDVQGKSPTVPGGDKLVKLVFTSKILECRKLRACPGPDGNSKPALRCTSPKAPRCRRSQLDGADESMIQLLRFVHYRRMAPVPRWDYQEYSAWPYSQSCPVSTQQPVLRRQPPRLVRPSSEYLLLPHSHTRFPPLHLVLYLAPYLALYLILYLILYLALYLVLYLILTFALHLVLYLILYLVLYHILTLCRTLYCTLYCTLCYSIGCPLAGHVRQNRQGYPKAAQYARGVCRGSASPARREGTTSLHVSLAGEDFFDSGDVWGGLSFSIRLG